MPSYIPLRWPILQTRTVHPRVALFADDRTLSKAVKALIEELNRVPGATNIVVTCNPSTPRHEDQGAAVWFDLPSGPHVFACDLWTRVEHNVWAIARHVDAVRSQARWGVGTVQQAFAGYVALPPSPDAKPYVESAPTEPCACGAMRPVLGTCPGCGEKRESFTRKYEPLQPGPWRRVFGNFSTKRSGWVTTDEIEERFKDLAFKHHPDRGGTDESMAILNNARDEALAELSKKRRA